MRIWVNSTLKATIVASRILLKATILASSAEPAKEHYPSG